MLERCVHFQGTTSKVRVLNKVKVWHTFIYSQIPEHLGSILYKNTPLKKLVFRKSLLSYFRTFMVSFKNVISELSLASFWAIVRIHFF